MRKEISLKDIPEDIVKYWRDLSFKYKSELRFDTFNKLNGDGAVNIFYLGRKKYVVAAILAEQQITKMEMFYFIPQVNVTLYPKKKYSQAEFQKLIKLLVFA
jgi:hypothetical protein